MSDVPGDRPGPEEARQLIFEDLDLIDAARAARAAHGWTDEEATEADLEYRRFLWLCYEHDGPAGALQANADKLWHHHILDTARYTADCGRIFGRYIHHTPAYALTEEERQQVYRQGLERYQRAYDRPLITPTASCV